jgi:hypothetical protein
MTTTDDTRVANLRQAAARKQADAEARARQAIKQARKTQQPVTFRGISEAAGVSTSFLYNNRELRAQIDRLRGSSTQRRPGHDPTGQVATLKALLEAAAREKTALLKRNEELTRRLAAAHGEMLGLRRQLGTSTNRSSPPPD